MADAAPEPGSPAAVARYWIAELEQSEKAQEKWLGRCKKVQERYREEVKVRSRRYALLYSNIQTIQPAIYARPPQPVVSRRFKDADPVGRIASEVLERALSYSVDKQDFDSALKNCTLDYVLLARGQAWERYVPTEGEEVTPQISVKPIEGGGFEDDEGHKYEAATEGPDGPTVAGEPFRPIVYEESVTDYVNWQDFGHSVARTWDEVWFVWRRAYLDRSALKKRFGDELGGKVPLDWGEKNDDRLKDEITCKAAIYEVWDKRTKKVRWISKAFGEGPLDERDDPLKLDGFFPCPKPLLGTTANDSLLPTPDYVYYQDQAVEIDELTQRIAELQDVLKVKGFYSAEAKSDLDALIKGRNTTMIPLAGWQGLKENGGLRGLIEWFPIDQVASALKACIELRKQLIEDVYQITGVADILRGASDPNETATAQGLKAQWGSVRVRERQKEVMRFSRDILRIKAEVIAETFSIDTLKAMTGLQIPTAEEKAAAEQQVQMLMQQAPPAQPGAPPAPPPPIPPQLEEILGSPTWEEVKALLEDDAARCFRIDVETDSTIEPNETEQKQQTVELMTALGSFIAQWGPVVQQQPAMAPVVAELLKWALRRFRAGRELEDVVEKAMAQLQSQPPPQEGAASQGDPNALPVEQMKLQTAQIEAQATLQAKQIDAQMQAAELPLRQNEQQLKLVALNRDPQPQASA